MMFLSDESLTFTFSFIFLSIVDERRQQCVQSRPTTQRDVRQSHARFTRRHRDGRFSRTQSGYSSFVGALAANFDAQLVPRRLIGAQSFQTQTKFGRRLASHAAQKAWAVQVSLIRCVKYEFTSIVFYFLIWNIFCIL